MDISIKVAGFKEVPGPLGGATIEYEIIVSTNIPELTRNSNGESNNAVFVVWKTFREIEDFQTKVCRKFPKSSICSSIGTEHKLQSEDTEERRIFADKFFANLAAMHHQCLPMLQEFFDCEHQQTCFNEKTSSVNNSPSKDNFDIFEEVREVVQLPDNKPVKGSSAGNLFAKVNTREEEADIFSTSEHNFATATTPSFESSMLSPTDSPFFFTPSTYKESDLFEGKPDQEMTEIKNPVRHSTLGSPGDLQSAYDEIQLLSVDDDISELMEALQRKQDRPSNTKPKLAPKPLDLTGSGRPVPLPRRSLQSKSTPDEPDTSVEALADAFNTSDILNYIEKEENQQGAAEPQLF